MNLSLRTAFCAVLLGCLSICGCEKPAAVDTRTMTAISGTVKVDGKPVAAPGLQIVFSPENQSAPVTIAIAPDGTYKGEAVPGKNYVSINAGMTADGGHDQGPRVGFGEVFLSPSSPLLVNVGSDGQPIDIEVGKAAAKTAGKPRIVGAQPPSSSAHGAH